jgi:hypothetical protein
MKTTSIVLAAFFMLAGAVYDSETATITFGIYYTFSPTHKVIENGVEKFFPTEPEEFKKNWRP